jgi:hypothetical protein
VYGVAALIAAVVLGLNASRKSTIASPTAVQGQGRMTRAEQ